MFFEKGTIHCVSCKHAKTAEVRIYDSLFSVESLDAEEGDFKDYLNPNSIEVIKEAYIEPYLKNANKDSRYQFVRKGYYSLDKDSTPENLVFNRTVSLKDAWTKANK